MAVLSDNAQLAWDTILRKPRRGIPMWLIKLPTRLCLPPHAG